MAASQAPGRTPTTPVPPRQSPASPTRSMPARPAVLRRWLENGPGPDRHRGDPGDEYAEVDWPTALDLLTRDAGTSALAQGCTGAHVLVSVERYDGTLPPVRAYDPPRLR